MTLPQFLILIAAVICAAGATVVFAASAGLPISVLAMLALLAAGAWRMLARVE